MKQQGFSPEGLNDPEREVFFSLCKQFNTPVSLSLWLRLKYDAKSFLEFDLKVGDYLECDSDRFAKDYLVSTLLSKWKGHDAGVDRESVALSKFVTSERVCAETNMRLRKGRSVGFDSDIESWLFQARRKIALLLGPCSLHCISEHFGWGPGATFDLSRRRAQVDRKMTTVPITVSPRAAELFRSVLGEDLHWSASILGLLPEGPFSFLPSVFLSSDSCRVTTVPKSAKTDRVIAIEPTGNLFLQKGVGGYFRRRLKRRGIDLDDQEINQRLAAQAGNLALATLDLSAASDTVSRELVYELFPLDWANLMDSLRSHKALMPDGTPVKLEKFSSMGNGFTFELESIIFWALGSCVRDDIEPEGSFSVYGDDIICPKSCAPDLIRLLALCGFSVNEEKSFVQGLFYESCGKHYFHGRDVTPVYQKEVVRPTSDVDDREAIRLHNRLVRWSIRSGIQISAQNVPFRSACKEVRSCLLPFGAEGDDGFLVPLEQLSGCTQDPSHGFWCRTIADRPRTLPGIQDAMLALRLRKDHPRQLRGNLWFDMPWDGEPSYGDVMVGVGAASAFPLKRRLSFRHRWVMPPGYCPLPIRR